MVKKYSIEMKLELSEREAKAWNDLVSRIKDVVISGGKQPFVTYKQPKQSFAEKVMTIPAVEIQETNIRPLNESNQFGLDEGSSSIFDQMNYLSRMSRKLIR